jgi:hypothetical protein
MNMPCKCEDTDEARVLKERGLPSAMLRFIGGFGKKNAGPYAQYETGKVYVVHEKFANQEIYKYWEPCDKEESIEPEEVDDGFSLILDGEVFMEEAEAEASTDSVEDEVVATEEVELEPSTGLDTLAYTINQGGDMKAAAGFSEREAINGMDTATLQAYIRGNHGKVDKRWGKKRLIQEALKL